MGLLIISIIILLIISIIYIKYKTTHRFWINQPVMKHCDTSLHKIGYIPKFEISLENNYKFKFNDNIEKIYSFINKFFSIDYSINKNLFKYSYQLPFATNISLYKSNILIGFIHSHTINLVFKNTQISINYVDYLCVNKDHRNNNLAAILISKLLNSFTNDSYCLFKKDKYTLPYSSILSSSYFYKKVPKNDTITNKNLLIYNISLHTKNVKEVYSFYIKSLEKYSLYIYEKYDEFYNKYVSSEISQLFVIENKNNTIRNIIIGKKIIYASYSCFEIDFILGDFTNNFYTHEQLSKILKIYKCDYYSLINMGDLDKYIKENKLYKSYKVYFYTYNINIPAIPINQFMININ